MDDYLKRMLVDAEINGLIAEQQAMDEDVDAIRDVERAGASLKDRCIRAVRFHQGLRVRLLDGSLSTGQCVAAGSDYLVLARDAATREAIPLACIAELIGLPEALPQPTPRTPSLRSVLRGIPGHARIRRVDGLVPTGHIRAVGTDHLDLDDTERGPCTIPLSAVLTVTWRTDATAQIPEFGHTSG